MRVLVTGGTGFIGSNLVAALLNRGDEVFITGKNEEREKQDRAAEIVGWDFSSLDWSKIGKVGTLFHEAAINDTTLMDRESMLKVNLGNSKNLFLDAVSAGCRRIVYASSTAVYGNGPAPYKENQPLEPLNPYAESKMLLDEWAMKYAAENPEVKIVGLRYCNVYGPGEGRKGKRATMIYQLAQQMKAGNPRIFEWGEQKRDYIYIKDVVRANFLAAFGSLRYSFSEASEPRHDGRAAEAKESCLVNCGFGEATSFNRIVAILNGVLGIDRKPEYFKNPYIGKYQDHTECDMSLAREKIGFVPEFNIESGIGDYFGSGFLV